MPHSDERLAWCPALGIAACFGAGIILESATDVATIIWIRATAGALVLLALVRFLPKRRMVDAAPIFSALIIAIAAVLAGATHAAIDRRPGRDDVAHHVPSLHGRNIDVDGRIRSFVERRDGRARFDVDIEQAGAGNQTVARRGRLLVRIADSEGERLRKGQRLGLRGRLSELPPRRNPADFDYGAFLGRRGIRGILDVEVQDLALLDGRPGLVDRVVVGARRRIESAIAVHVPSDQGRLMLRALLMGDRSGLSREDRERLARSGLMHLLAVSGLHVLLVGMVLYKLLRPMLLRMRCGWRAAEWFRSVLTVAILCLYMLITGSSASVVRAVIMAALFIGATLAQRPVHSLNTLGAAALIILLGRPAEIFSAGFQLSFSAVGAIILFGSHMRAVDSALRERMPWLRFAGNSIAVSLAATLGTLPVLLAHFGRASFAGLILNIAAIPATFGVLASGLLMVITAGVNRVTAASFGASGDFLANVVMTLAAEGERWAPVALVEQQIHSGWSIAAAGSSVAVLALWRMRRVRWKMTAIALALCAGGTWSGARPSGALDIIFFDVGQGDATLIRSPGGRTLLIDAGPRNQHFDAGARVLAPNLAHLGVRHLDAVVISHPHSDHLGGLPHLLRSMSVSTVLHNGEEHESALFDEVRTLLDSLNVEHRSLSAGEVIELDNSVFVKVLAPVEGRSTSINDASVVLRLVHGEVSLLMTGDAEANSEALLTDYFPSLLASTLIKAGHHGSSTSSTESFVSHAGAGMDEGSVVVSVAERNRYRHPSPDVIERWRSSGRSLHLTSDEGAVWFRSDGSKLRRIDWR